MTTIWMGIAKISKEVEAGNLELDGNPAIAGAMQHWLGINLWAHALPSYEQPSMAAAAR